MSEFKKLRVGLINLKLNNIFSIYQAFRELEIKTEIIPDSLKKYNYDMVVLPGDGAFKQAMKTLKQKNTNEKIFEYLEKKNVKLFGICLGMQLLFDQSEEYGISKGLGLIKGKVKKLSNENQLVPNIGWKKVINNKNIFFTKNKLFYFIHSFYCDPINKNEILGFSHHGNFKFCASVQKKNIFATQFHPEKSGEDGIKLLKKICIKI